MTSSPYIWVCERAGGRTIYRRSQLSLWHREGHLRVNARECQSQPQSWPTSGRSSTTHVTRLGVDAGVCNGLARPCWTSFPTSRSGRRSIDEVHQRTCEAMERLILEKKCRHGGHPVMRWMASNARVVKDHSENVRLDKRVPSEWMLSRPLQCRQPVDFDWIQGHHAAQRLRRTRIVAGLSIDTCMITCGSETS